jgi:hypothetical protein
MDVTDVVNKLTHLNAHQKADLLWVLHENSKMFDGTLPNLSTLKGTHRIVTWCQTHAFMALPSSSNAFGHIQMWTQSSG